MKKKTQPHHHHHHHRNQNHNNNNNNNNNSVFDAIKALIFGRHVRLSSHLLPSCPASLAVFYLVWPLYHFYLHLSTTTVSTAHSNHQLDDVDEDKIDFRANIGNTSTFLFPRAGGSVEDVIWTSSESNIYYGCSQRSKNFQAADEKADPNRFLMIITSGGLNKQRIGITDAVVAAYILNSTLVVPTLDNRSYWKDQSNFSDIFDVDWFMSYLSKDVSIVKELPMIDGKIFQPYRTRVPRMCDLECYESRVLPLLVNKKVVMLTKYDYRLSNNLDIDLQKLRCQANYHALRYTDPIREMGKRLVERMRMKSEQYITLHLRYEPDMLAFSGCYFGGGDKERRELEQIRTRWETLPKKNPDTERRLGRCPLTPEEVGLLLRALGYGEDVHIYVASGEVYGGEDTLLPLKELFPNFHSKATLATQEELAPFAAYSSRMAALDFIVSNESDIFVTNNNGNRAKMLAGTRRYFGYRPTIRPNSKKLYRLFLDRGNMTWEEFASRVRTHQIGFMGRPNESKPGKGQFYEYPITCICEDSNSHNQSRNDTQSESQNHCRNQSEPNNHDAQENHRHGSELEFTFQEQLTNKEHNVSLAQCNKNDNGTRAEDLTVRNNFNMRHGGGEECHPTNP
ncbi:protein ROOT HAIR SPECIFIC 17-like [Bidens hawaiensis]|uniref:protein ROOT HAIR SPECIFIC 17-like n=1 Tax=Bidens hawaiensis TaxID=980011 RepID=UPI00404A2F4A